MQKLSINSIYMATEGEGVNVGTPQIFVRFQGCAIGCLNCDSKETWEFSEANDSMHDVLAKIDELAGKPPYSIKRVSITGGDPLHPKLSPQVLALAEELKKKDYFLNIEASGTRVVSDIFDIVDFISFDLKTPSTGAKTPLKNLEKIHLQYSDKSQVKAVISDKKDFEFTFDTYQKVLETKQGAELPWVLTPCYEPGEDFPQERFLEIIDLNQKFGSPFRVIGQQHKWIHGPNRTQI